MEKTRTLELTSVATAPLGGVLNRLALLDGGPPVLGVAGDDSFQFVIDRGGFPKEVGNERVVAQWSGTYDNEVQGTWVEPDGGVAAGVVAAEGGMSLLLTDSHLRGSMTSGHVRSPSGLEPLAGQDTYVFAIPLDETEWIMANKKTVGLGSQLEGFSTSGIVPARGESWESSTFGNMAGAFARELLAAVFAAKEKHPDANVRDDAFRLRASGLAIGFGEGRKRVEINFASRSQTDSPSEDENQLQRLLDLYAEGAISRAQFDAARARLPEGS